MKKFAKIVPLSLALALPAMAQSTSDDAGLLSSKHIDAELQARAVYSYSNNADSDTTSLSKTYLKLTGKFTEDIRLVLTAELNRALRENGVNVATSQQIDEYLKEAYVEIRNIGGQPIAFVIGKHQVAFGEEIKRMPIYENSPLYNKLFSERVLGFTVRLNYNLFNVVDGIEASFYQSQQDIGLLEDGKFGTYDSVSARIKGQINGGIRYNASFAHVGNNHLGDGQEENKGAVGLIFAKSFDKNGVAEGPWTAWVNGLVTDKTTNGDDLQFAVTGGASYEVGPGEVVVEATWLQDQSVQLGIGYKMALYTNDDGTVAATIAPEYRHTFGLNGNPDDDSIGVAVSFNMGTVKQPVRKAVFGPKKVEAPAPTPAN